MLLFRGGQCASLTVNTIDGHHVPSGFGHHRGARATRARRLSTSAWPSAPARDSRWCASSSWGQGCTGRAAHHTVSTSARRGRSSGRSWPGQPAPGRLAPHVPWKASDSIPFAVDRPQQSNHSWLRRQSDTRAHGQAKPDRDKRPAQGLWQGLEPITNRSQQRRAGVEAKVTESRRGAVVEFDRVTKRYGGKGDAAAVQELSMRAPGGEVCVLVGPSGGGTTTTLKMVNRLVEPSSGHVLLDGDDIGRRNPVELRRRIGYVIQQTGLFPHLTVGANVATVPRLLGWDSPRVHARVDELIDLVGLDPDKYRDRYPAQLSGGERQRIGVARAIATDPPVLLMDEPFGAVDPITRERLQNEFLRLQQQLDTTILFVTHDIDEAIKMGDRIAVFKPGGRLAQFDTPMTVLEQPADDRPAGWLSRKELDRPGPLGAERAGTPEPLLDRESTLRDALSAMLGSAVQEGLVVDERGRLLGSLSIEAVSSVLRQEEPVGS